MSRKQLKRDLQSICPLGSCRFVRLPCRLVSLRRPRRDRTQYSCDAHDVARRHGELEVLVYAPHPAVDRLADAPHCLGPAEMLLDALADRLAQRIAPMARRASINRAAPAPGVIACYVRRDVAFAARGDKVLGVIGLVRTEALGLAAADGIEHRERCSTLP